MRALLSYMWECSIDLVVFKTNFQNMCLKYQYIHSVKHSQCDSDRLNIVPHRLSEAWYLYSLIEQKQRYLLPGPVSRGEEVEEALSHYHSDIRSEFSRYTVTQYYKLVLYYIIGGGHSICVTNQVVILSLYLMVE